jgi:DNA-binding transcriptional MerR regulator
MVQSQEPSPPPTWLRIGEVAEKAGVSVDTVRFYERRGLLATPERTPSGYRKYSSSAIDRIVLTRRLRRLGMTLEEIAAALRAEEHGRDCSTELWRL